MARATSSEVPTNDTQVKEIREWTAYADREWLPIRDEAGIDMRAASGDPWDPKERKARERANRPVLVFDEFQQYINQVVNDFRANPIGVQFSPVADGATDDTARFYEDKMREIEYRSNAQIHYTTAAENAVMRSYGFVRVTTRYESERSANQDIWIDGFPNPDLVTPDPDAVSPDLADQKRCLIRERYSFADFKRKWPGAKVQSFGSDVRRLAPKWVHADHLFVGELWEVRTTPKKLSVVALPQLQPLPQGQPAPDPVGLFDDEIAARGGLPQGARVLHTRTVDVPRVVQVITNGLEVLAENPWAGKYVPVVGCLGRVLYIPGDDGSSERVILSMIRLARDPFMLYCYYRSTEAEIVGMTPKFPWFYYEGSLAPDQAKLLQKANKEPVTAIAVKAQIPGLPPGTPTPFPSRNPWEPPIQAFEIGGESARRGIQAAMGWTALPTDAQRVNNKSGTALRHIESTGQRGMYHFRDHYQLMVRQVGVVCEDLIDKYLDTPRNTGVRRKDGTSEIIRINDPQVTGATSTKGSHLTTVSTGPAFDSQREAASDFADTLAQMSPQVFQLLGPMIVKLKNLGPLGDEIVELLEAVQPPAVQALRDAKKKKDDPQVLQRKLSQAMMQLQQLQQIASQMHQALSTDAAKAGASLKLKALDIAFQRWKTEFDAETKIAVAELGAKTERLALFLEERGRIGLQDGQAADQAHEADQAALDRTHELNVNDLDHQQGLAAGAQAGAIASDQQAAQLAAQTPPGDAGGGGE